MRHGSLFSGIGGFDLAAQWMGWENVFHCEWNEFGKRVLSYYWPNAISYHDIIKTDFIIHRGGIDILTGGFPCQPYSLAGKRKGKEDERHLWPEMLRAIREIQPRWVVGENVLGLVNWDGGLVFDEVQADLEAAGYEVQPYVLPACGVNAPHRRDRVWFVAYSKLCSTGQDGNSNQASGRGAAIVQTPGQGREREAILDSGLCGLQRASADVNLARREERGQTKRWEDTTENTTGLDNRAERFSNNGYSTHIDKKRFYTEGESTELEGKRFGKHNAQSNQPNWDNFPTQSPVRSGNDGFSFRLDGITFPKWRNESIKAAGNAIVPQVAYQIFKAIEVYEKGN